MKIPRPPLTKITLSVVLPVLNEEQVLPVLLARVTAAAQSLGIQHEVVFVNDGSKDGSAAVLDGFAVRNSVVRVIHLSRNFGHQAAVQAGLEHARGDLVWLMDSDLQDDPESLGRFIEQWQQGYDVVYAIRRDRKESLMKRALFAAFHRMLAAVASTPIPADAGNFSLMDARVVRQMVALSERDRYLPGLRAWVGFRQIGIEVRRGKRYDEQPRVSLRGLFRLAKTAIYSFSTLPLVLFHVLGLASMVTFAVLTAFSLYFRLFTDVTVPGWTSTVLIATFFGAINSLGISMLGEYVTRIYDQVRSRPIYLVGETRNMERAWESHALDSDASNAPVETALLQQASDCLADLRATVDGEFRRRASDRRIESSDSEEVYEGR
jgi:dolichol-phosphate mannosyltransferase